MVSMHMMPWWRCQLLRYVYNFPIVLNYVKCLWWNATCSFIKFQGAMNITVFNRGDVLCPDMISYGLLSKYRGSYAACVNIHLVKFIIIYGHLWWIPPRRIVNVELLVFVLSNNKLETVELSWIWDAMVFIWQNYNMLSNSAQPTNRFNDIKPLRPNDAYMRR